LIARHLGPKLVSLDLTGCLPVLFSRNILISWKSLPMWSRHTCLLSVTACYPCTVGASRVSLAYQKSGLIWIWTWQASKILRQTKWFSSWGVHPTLSISMSSNPPPRVLHSAIACRHCLIMPGMHARFMCVLFPRYRWHWYLISWYRCLPATWLNPQLFFCLPTDNHACADRNCGQLLPDFLDLTVNTMLPKLKMLERDRARFDATQPVKDWYPSQDWSIHHYYIQYKCYSTCGRYLLSNRLS